MSRVERSEACTTARQGFDSMNRTNYVECAHMDVSACASVSVCVCVCVQRDLSKLCMHSELKSDDDIVIFIR